MFEFDVRFEIEVQSVVLTFEALIRQRSFSSTTSD